MNKLKSWFFPIVILIIISFIAFKNLPAQAGYTPNTYLTGWDNLHPEFNFKLNIERSLNAVWQEYQGVGLLGGMAHSADLPRQLVLTGFATFLPTSLIRYFWTFLMLFIGPLGMYFLLRKKTKLGGFTASLFYIFNLATVQYFFVPFETFVGFYGFLPWLIYFAIEFLDTGKKIWKYALVSLFAVSAFYVQTLFLVYGIFLFILVFKNIKRGFKLLLVTFLINAFWLLPALWFSFTSSQIPINSEINRIATPETVLMNQARNDFISITNLKGYWFDYYDFGKDNKFDYLFKDWIAYGDAPYVKEIGIGLFIISVLGLVISRQMIWLLLLGIGYLMLAGIKLPIAVLEEAFRNSFTKWSVAFAFVISIGISYFVVRFRKFAIIPAIIIICASIYTTWPVFKGKLISERVRVKIPNEYFDTFNWFNQKSDGGRVAFFPAFDKWGWNYHDWGYGGSGFIWYGIKNPILDRAFNVWSPYNEGYYKEITKAILDNNIEIFANTISKYQVKYLFLDDSVVYPWGEKELLKLETTRQLAVDLGYKKVFNKNFITIYDTNINSDFVKADLTYSKIDPIYQKILLNDQKIVENFDSSHGYPEATNCDLKKNGEVYRDNLSVGRIYKATNGGVSCDYFVYEELKYNQGYVMHIKGENNEGRGLKIYLYNWESKRVELEELLTTGKFDSYFVIYPSKNTNSGFTLNVETRSFGRIASENKIELIEFIPYIETAEPTFKGSTFKGNLEVLDVKKFGTAFYKVKTTGSGVLQLGQGYDKGWISYLKMEHIKVNTWSNGWLVNNEPIIYLIFWPQLFQWFGFLVLGLTTVYLIVQSKK